MEKWRQTARRIFDLEDLKMQLDAPMLESGIGVGVTGIWLGD